MTHSNRAHLEPRNEEPHMAKLTAEIRNFTDADVFLGSKKARKLANNTYVEAPDYSDDIIGVRLHATVIVTYHRDGRIILNTGGWNTPTTASRLHQLVPLGVSAGIRRGDLVVTKYHNEPTGEIEFDGYP